MGIERPKDRKTERKKDRKTGSQKDRKSLMVFLSLEPNVND